jgi:hypothetical protein
LPGGRFAGALSRIAVFAATAVVGMLAALLGQTL